MKGLKKTLTIVVSAAVCAGASEIPIHFSDSHKNDNSSDTFILGDVLEDGAVNASDASIVLSEYSILSTGKTSSFTEKQMKAADVNGDGKFDSIDATIILAYYSHISTSEYMSVEEFVENEY